MNINNRPPETPHGVSWGLFDAGAYARCGLGVVAALALSLFCSRASALDAPLVWYATLTGDVACALGGEDCNPCAFDVREQFARMAEGEGVGVTYQTKVEHDRNYPPAQDYLDDFRVVQARSHFQGISRIQSTSALGGGDWYAVSIGGKIKRHGLIRPETKPTGFALLQMDGERRGRLRYWNRAHSYEHAGGLAAVGRYLFVAVDRNSSKTSIDVFDTARMDEVNWRDSENVARRYVGTELRSKIASVAATKLASGDYLVAAHRRSYCITDSDPCEIRFYLTSDLSSLSDWREAGASVGLPYGAEGLSLVNECGTGDVYAISNNGGDHNEWVLYSVEMSSDGFRAEDIDYSIRPVKNSANCETRGPGSVYADRDGKLTFLCHEKEVGDRGNDTYYWNMAEWSLPEPTN